MARSNRSRNNNPEGKNQYSNSWMDSAKERPYTAAAVTAAAVGAGVFLWSRRNQISDQISGLSDQISDWSNNMRSGMGEGDMAAQEQFSQEALTLKETGKKSKGPRGPIAQQDIKAGIVESNQEAKAGAKAYS